MDDLYYSKRKSMRKSIITDTIAASFVFLFVYAAFSKIMDYHKFKVQLGQSPLLTAFAGWVAWVIPTIEIAIALILATNKFRLVGLYASFSLMTMFTAYIIAITKFSDYIPCSCGGILQKMTWSQHLIFNCIFVVLALIGILFHTEQKSIPRQHLQPG